MAGRFRWAPLLRFLLGLALIAWLARSIGLESIRGALTPIFKLKIGASIVATVSLVILLIWRAVQPAVLNTPSSARWIFLILAVIMLGAVGLAGHMGGKLVFGNRKH